MSGNDPSTPDAATRVRDAELTRIRGGDVQPDAAPRAVDAVAPAPGGVIKDRFLIQREIGRGGMGVVFAAEDRRKVEAGDPDPMVAVKVLSSEYTHHPVMLVALQREARRAQALAHPNVATVFDFDRDGDVVYMTMELLSGQPLDAVLREAGGAGVERTRALSIVTGIARGLAHAHLKGLVHADLKPGNVFLTEEDVPRILDFGIARAVPGSAAGKRDAFDAGELGAYTEAYATREMVDGEDLHPSDDVYALGLIAYELLTGRHPFQRRGAKEASALGLRPHAIKGLPRRQWHLIERSLSFDRARRPADAGVFLRGLSGVTGLHKALIAASIVLALAACYFGYARYQASGPETPYRELSPEIQRQFTAAMQDGDASWRIYEQGGAAAFQDSMQYYTTAWTLHPRNRDATRAIRKVADRVMADFPQERAENAQTLVEVGPGFLAGYGPVRESLPAGSDTP